MTKAEAERAIRYLCQEWRRARGLEQTPERDLSFFDFHAWVASNHSSYLNFRTTTSVLYDVQMWFEREFPQTR